ncbi:hypothetical protein NVP1054O_44 [Vibrio phage 1.054.O._10N.261.52.A1]|nr:hypothetical protein NVP1054O_44 [Vibrio phage 1.054.O._10N.261.52.A1]
MLNKRATYGDDWGVPSAEHPAGECLNRSAPGVEDGSYFEKAWVNDLMALPGAIMNAAGYTPNGTEDTATASQVFDALVNSRWSAIANYTAGTIVTASDGKQYCCKLGNGRGSSVVNPVGDISGSWIQYPEQIIEGPNGIALKRANGVLTIDETVSGITSSTLNSNGKYEVTIPITFAIPYISPPKIQATPDNDFPPLSESTSTNSITVTGFNLIIASENPSTTVYANWSSLGRWS